MIEWSKAHEAAREMMGKPHARHVLLAGGSRSGKTFLLCYQLAVRALKSPCSRHAILRHRFNAVKTAVALDTWPKMMGLAFPGLPAQMDKTDWYYRFPNNSEVWFGGLDDSERVEKILGREYATIFLNEISQISYASREIAKTRLAQKCKMIDGKPLVNRMYYDCNPPSKAHWSYRLWIEHKDPVTRQLLADPEQYVWMRINPRDNEKNLSSDYIRDLEAMSPAARRRFLDGEWSEATPGALFSAETIDQHRVMDGRMPQLIRVVVAVDPSGAGSKDDFGHDSIGIVVVGLGVDGRVYLIEDLTVLAAPAVWGKIATDAYQRHRADCVIGEINYGGAMVRHVIQSSDPRIPFREVHASRGKAVRAEPISALYEQGKVRHVGHFVELEDELLCFSQSGYLGDKSPNRADALVWGISSLFPGVAGAQSSARDEKIFRRHSTPTMPGMGF